MMHTSRRILVLVLALLVLALLAAIPAAGAAAAATSSGPGAEAGRTGWQQLSVGDHTCARKTSGRLFCWGANSYGELGIGSQRRPGRAGGGRRVVGGVALGGRG